ncbi:MAG: hypothetical protein PF569_00130 [Candidatus Woesearchaeota archaeon]|jgi:hypothetical protein|nr:hypothetical protein [Candidatus Woesearchaeota archaeon]
MKINKIKLIPFVLIFIGLIFLVYAATYYQVNSGATVTIDEQGICKEVTNNNGLAMFVPTNSLAEWTAFRDNAVGVTINDCAPDCVVGDTYSQTLSKCVRPANITNTCSTSGFSWTSFYGGRCDNQICAYVDDGLGTISSASLEGDCTISHAWDGYCYRFDARAGWSDVGSCYASTLYSIPYSTSVCPSGSSFDAATQKCYDTDYSTTYYCIGSYVLNGVQCTIDPVTDIFLGVSCDSKTLCGAGPYTLTWTNMLNVDSCTASGLWSGAKSVTGGSEDITAIINGQTCVGGCDFTLTCPGAYGTVVKTVTVLDTSASSCPLLFYKDALGEFEYITDISSGVLGLVNNKFAQYYNTSNIIVPIKPDIEGNYEFVITEPMDEISYVDDAKLMLIDAPKGIEIVHTGIRSAVMGSMDYKISTISNSILPSKVVNRFGNDVTSKFTKVDNKATFVDIYEDDYFDLYFDDIKGNKNAKLIIDLWTYMTSQGEQLNHPFKGNVYPYIEVMDENGDFVKVMDWPYSTADMKSIVIELGDIFKSENKVIRLHTGKYHPLSETMIDRIRYDESEPVDYNIKEVKPFSADLEDKSLHSFKEQNTVSRMIAKLDPNSVDQSGDYPYYGNYTKLGNVLPLLLTRDDKYVIMRKGDMMTLKFNYQNKVKDDEERTIIFSSKTWFRVPKSQDYSNEYPDPYPYTGMQEYPYNESKIDGNYFDYAKEWNTREYKKLNNFLIGNFSTPYIVRNGKIDGEYFS